MANEPVTRSRFEERRDAARKLEGLAQAIHDVRDPQDFLETVEEAQIALDRLHALK